MQPLLTRFNLPSSGTAPENPTPIHSSYTKHHHKTKTNISYVLYYITTTQKLKFYKLAPERHCKPGLIKLGDEPETLCLQIKCPTNCTTYKLYCFIELHLNMLKALYYYPLSPDTLKTSLKQFQVSRFVYRTSRAHSIHICECRHYSPTRHENVP